MRRMLVPTMAAVTALTSFTAPALAQNGPVISTAIEPRIEPSAKRPVAPPLAATATPAVPAMCQVAISKGARPALLALQTAVVAKDAANIPALVTAARAVAKSNDDRCFIGQMQLKAAVDANDLKAAPAALEAQLASSSVPAAKIASLYEDLGQLDYQAADYTSAASAYERALALDSTRSMAVILLAETRAKQNRLGDALPLYRKAIAMETAAGRVADAKWYGRALTTSYAAKNPLAYGFARDWVAAYPTPGNWRDAVRIYSGISGANNDMMVDLYRLQRQTRSLSGEADYGHYAQTLLDKGYPGEAKAVLDEGFAAGTADRNTASLKALSALANSKAAGDRAALDGQSKAALASPAAKQAMTLGEAYYGYGDYAKAATMFRAAQGKSGVDANLANLRLGMALAASGDKTGARTALATVSGPRAEIARYWTTYASARP